MNKTILITGVSSGIGKASALLFAQEGWNVIATMRNKKNNVYLSNYQNVLITELDVTKQATIDNSLREGISRFGKIDVLLNNAGCGFYGVFEEASEEIIQKQLDVNLFGVMRMIKSSLPYLRKEKGGLILNVTSVGRRMALPYLSLYYTSKWGVEGLSEALKFELSPLGIRVKVIEPGIVNTDFGQKLYYFSKHDIKEYGSINDKISEVCFQLLGTLASEPEAIAEVIYKAAMDESDQFRYPAGADAKQAMKIRENICDKDFFALINNMDSYQKKFQEKSFENERNKKKFGLLCQWMKLKNNGIRLWEFFQDRQIQSIAIYGMGEIGQLLYNELFESNEQLVHYAIDRTGRRYVENLPTYRLNRNLPKVDAIIITPVLITDQLEDEIYETIGDCNTFVFEELLYELSRKHKISSQLWRSLC